MTSEWANVEPIIRLDSGLPLTHGDGLLLNRLHGFRHFRGVEVVRCGCGCGNVTAIVAFNRTIVPITGPVSEVLAMAVVVVGGWDA